MHQIMRHFDVAVPDNLPSYSLNAQADKMSRVHTDLARVLRNHLGSRRRENRCSTHKTLPFGNVQDAKISVHVASLFRPSCRIFPTSVRAFWL